MRKARFPLLATVSHCFCKFPVAGRGAAGATPAADGTRRTIRLESAGHRRFLGRCLPTQGDRPTMTHHMQNNALDQIGELLAEQGFDGMAQAIAVLLNEAMKLERAGPRRLPYERSEGRQGHANGYKPKTSRPAGLRHPGRPPGPGQHFYPRAWRRAPQRAGASAGRGRDVRPGRLDPEGGRDHPGALRPRGSSARSAGPPSCSTRNSSMADRPLGDPYLILDARYEKVRHGGSVVSCAVLMAIGIDAQGRRAILGTSVWLSEAEVHWREFLADSSGPWPARRQPGHQRRPHRAEGGPAARFSGVPWQRCQFHLAKNAMAYVPKVAMRKEVGASLRAVFDAPDRRRGRTATGPGGDEVPDDGPAAGRVAGGQRARGTDGLRAYRRATGGG